MRYYIIYQQCHAFGHAPCTTAGTESTALATELQSVLYCPSTLTLGANGLYQQTNLHGSRSQSIFARLLLCRSNNLAMSILIFVITLITAPCSA